MLLCLSTGFIYLLFFLKYPLFYSVLSFCSFCFTTLVFSRTYSFLHCQGITWQIIWFFSLSYGTYGNWTSKKASSGEAPKDIIALKKSFMLSCEIQFSGRYEHLLHLKLFFVLKLEMLSCVPVDFSFFQVGCGFVCLQLFYNLVSLGIYLKLRKIKLIQAMPCAKKEKKKKKKKNLKWDLCLLL